MDRRCFLRTGLVLGATAPLVVACGPTTTDASGATSADPSRTGRRMSGPASDSAPTPPGGTAGTGGRVLLAFFSRPGENYSSGGRVDLEVGNTQVVADMISAAVPVDVFRIRAADPYPDDYEQTVARNVQEERDDARPALADPLPDVAGHDTVLLGCPVWNSRAPMIMRTVVEGLDLTGKTVHPFVTFAVSGMGRVRSEYVDLLPGSTVGEGLAVRGETATQAGPEVTAWLRQLALTPA